MTVTDVGEVFLRNLKIMDSSDQQDAFTLLILHLRDSAHCMEITWPVMQGVCTFSAADHSFKIII